MKRSTAAAFVTLAAALIVWLPATASAELSWRGTDLAAKGIHKGAGLPLFALYIDGAHSSFATQELSNKHAALDAVHRLVQSILLYRFARDERGNEVPGRFHIGTIFAVMRVILPTPLRTERVQHFVEVVPTFLVTDFGVGESGAHRWLRRDVASAQVSPSLRSTTARR